LRQYPDTIVCRNLVDAATVDLLSDQIELNRTVITTIRAKDSAEALLRVLMLKASPRKFAKAVGAVINQRLIRKLCDDCKEAYAPTPQLLTQLRLPQGKIEAFYRPPTPNEEQREEVCETCKGVGYLGRTGVFELLIVDDTVREVLIKSPKIDLLRKAARKAGMRSLQDEGVLMVARGVTSIQELSRVLKQ
jgi:type II secretory ATPase GspE/PulE/Tfp pilus assembly ATPase PilB-like protein